MALPTADPVTNPSGPPPIGGQPPGTSPDDHTLWYYRVDEQQYGPATTAEVRNLIGSGRLGPLDYVWRDGLMEWSTVEETAELGSRSLLPPAMPFASGGDRGRRRRRAWLFAILILAIAALAVASAYLGLFGKLAALIPGAADAGPNPLPAPAAAPAEVEPGGADDAEPVDTGAINSNCLTPSHRRGRPEPALIDRRLSVAKRRPAKLTFATESIRTSWARLWPASPQARG
jgi:hypothetical protein